MDQRNKDSERTRLNGTLAEGPGVISFSAGLFFLLFGRTVDFLVDFSTLSAVDVDISA
jgi:hypothetical protein